MKRFPSVQSKEGSELFEFCGVQMQHCDRIVGWFKVESPSHLPATFLHLMGII